MVFTDREYILLFANHMMSKAGAKEEDRFFTPEEAIAWMDQAIKREWIDPDDLLPINPKSIPEWAREAYTIAVDHKGD